MASETDALREYLRAIDTIYRAGHATEHSYRGPLADLFHALAPSILATNEPKRGACGAPDYVITRGTGPTQRTIGYAEAKDIGAPLAQIESDEQFTRYRRALENLLLTDYLKFRWFLAGKSQATARIATLQGGRIVADPTHANLFRLPILNWLICKFVLGPQPIDYYLLTTNLDDDP